MVFPGAVPVYVYECGGCSLQWEYLQSMNDPPKKKCEKCGGKLEKIIAPTAFVLKGGGWYKDLYSSPSPKGDAKSEAKSDAKSDAKGEAKSETKSEAKASSSEASKTTGAAASKKKPSGGSKE